MAIRTILALAASLCALAPALASAQLFNRPFEFQRHGGAGEAVGMSTAYRQAILERELLNRRPENLVRDRSGQLLDVVEGRSNQAFLRAQAQPFLPGATVGFGFGVGGISVGSGTAVTGDFGYGAAAPGRVFLRWSSMVGEENAPATWNGVGGGSTTAAGAVIESWIMQLASLE